MSVLGNDVTRFAVVGAAGFLVDSFVLLVLVHAGEWDPLSARIMSMSIAVICTWFGHRNWSFRTGHFRSQTVIYGLVQLLGLSINYAVFSGLIFTSAFWREFPVLAVAGGSLAAMGVTYLLSKTVAFAGPPGNLPLRDLRRDESICVLCSSAATRINDRVQPS